MKPKSFNSFLALALGALTVSFGGFAQAVAITWDSGASPDLTWANGTNWTGTPDNTVPGASDVAVFGNTGAAASGATSTVGANISIGGLTFNHTANQHSVDILSGVTLSLGGNFTANTTATSNITGLGKLAQTGTNFDVAASTGGATTVVNLADLTEFSSSVTNFRVGFSTSNSSGSMVGTLTLANTNTIAATNLFVGVSSAGTSTNGGTGTVNFGQSNTIYADTITIGAGKSSGSMGFTSGSGTATVTIRGAAGGSSKAALNLGIQNLNTGAAISGTLDFGSAMADAKFSTINMGSGATGTGTGTGTGTLAFGAGAITADTVNVGLGTAATTSTAPAEVGTGVINMNGGTFTATDVFLGRQNNTASAVRARANGTFNQSGGTANITTVTIGDRTSTTAPTAGANVFGFYNLSGGTLKAQTIQAGGNGANWADVSNTRQFNWSGGTIQNLSGTNLTMSAGSGLVYTLSGATDKTFNADNGQSITVNSGLTGSGGNLVKTGAGTLYLNATNTYTNSTMVDVGTLIVGGGGTGSITSNVAVASGATLGGSGTITGNVTLAAETSSGAKDGGKLAAGNSPGVLTVDGNTSFNTGSIFEWEINATGTPSRGTGGYDGVNTDSVAGDGDAIFQIVLQSGQSFADTFWDDSRNWSDIFKDTTASNNLTDWTNLFTSFGGSVGANGIVSGQGSFSFTNGNTLTWTAVPEPTSAVAGLLITAGLLRRRRAHTALVMGNLR